MYLGIDLGTSNSAVFAHIDGELRIFKSADKGTDVLPSVIYIDRRKNKFYGHRAYEHLFRNPGNAVDGFKRHMGTSWKKEFADSGIVMDAEECSAEILRQLMEQSRMESGGRDISGVVITTPAAFNTMQIEATHRAAKMAGLEHIALVQEPVAAGLAAVAKNKNKDGLFLVYDIGGGTFDLALAQSVKGSINILAHEGINALGGRDFDRIIANSVVRPWLMDEFSLPANFQKYPKYEKVIRIAKMAVENAKIELSISETATINLSEEDLRVTDEKEADIYINIEINRRQLEELVADKVDETIALSRKILQDNGYESSDLDRLVFVGGPSKTPFLRQKIPHELGVPVDLDVDPMTVVANGAAIFCEGLDWSGKTTSRKATRKTKKSKGGINLQYDNRTADDRAHIRIKPQDNSVGENIEIQIDSNEGWTSGRRSLGKGVKIDLPLNRVGDHDFRIQAFDKNGNFINGTEEKITITRTVATAGSLRLTHNLAAAIVSGEGDEKENILHIFAEKGVYLPAEGIMPGYRAARDLRKNDSSIVAQFFEAPDKGNLTPGEPNLFIGSCEISRDEIESDIRAGDEFKIHWEVSESQVINLSIELASGDIIGGKFYSSKGGERNYEGEEGELFVEGMLKDAKKELSDVKEIADSEGAPAIRKLKNSLGNLGGDLENAADGEERRGIAEKVRDIRQNIAKIRNNPQNRITNLQSEMQNIVEGFDKYCRENADEDVSEKFDERAQQAQNELDNGESGYDDAKRHVNEMKNIFVRKLWKSPDFIIRMFKHWSELRYSAIDRNEHDSLVKEGKSMLNDQDFDGLGEVTKALMSNQIDSGGSASSVSKFSDIMRK